MEKVGEKLEPKIKDLNDEKPSQVSIKDSPEQKHQNIAQTIQKVVQNQNHPLNQRVSAADRYSDMLTTFIGSWVFILLFLVYVLFWVGINTIAFIEKWDPFPFIFLNLTLSILAAIQAPIILMAQNRQSQKDRIRFEYDYAIDRKSEREIAQIKEQLDRIEKRLNK